MLFNSFAFAIFLPIVFILYWALPHKYRWILILIASYYFYMSWNIKYVVLILFTTVISYGAARILENAKNQKEKKWILAGTTILCLGVLFFFKYFNFVSDSVMSFLRIFAIPVNRIELKLLLPVGISFYTFQTLSYVIDVYKGDIKAEHHFGHYAAFISFFPQLVAGPIERTKNLLPQIKEEHSFHYEEATYGLKLMAWVFFKKVVIADHLASYVSAVYDSPRNFTGFSLLLATILFTIQIYCDFSGYSDIAIGSAKLLDIQLMTNFKSPYFSQSIKEFWGRWHISLSTWFRDYVYIPLGGSLVGPVKHARNLLVTFLVSGLWHGANWTFVIWGGIHGLGQIMENLLISKEQLKKRSKGFMGFLRGLFVFIFTSFAWIFFVSNSLSDAVYVISHMFSGITSPVSYLHNGFSSVGFTAPNRNIILIFIALLGVYDYLSMKRNVIDLISKQKAGIRYLIYLILLCVILLFRATRPAEFVYFQF